MFFSPLILTSFEHNDMSRTSEIFFLSDVWFPKIVSLILLLENLLFLTSSFTSVQVPTFKSVCTLEWSPFIILILIVLFLISDEIICGDNLSLVVLR
ncbi:hypothetical protein PUN28_011091 [Cardiocondyla obscurior]|uniref:Uncharacterized protein n=1 Tax=Cardiocondyla obscurior TaxID=286306 RepID=A0AAW2FJ46_9HYME